MKRIKYANKYTGSGAERSIGLKGFKKSETPNKKLTKYQPEKGDKLEK